MRRTLGGALAATLLAARAWAGGFEIYDQSPSATAMAGAVSAKADEPAAMFYNPAGIAMRPGGYAYAGGTIAFTSFSSTSLGANPVTTDAKNGIFPLPTLHVAAHIGKPLAIGLGVFTPFGSGAEWNALATDGKTPFPGRFVASNTQLQTVVINPTIGLRPNDRFAIAGGVDVMLASIELSRSLQIADHEGTAHLGGSTQAVGFNAGVMVNLVPDRLVAGLSWRSGYDLDLDEVKVHFDAPPELRANVFDQKARTSLRIPNTVTFGLATWPTDRLAITTDLHYTRWSEFKTISVAFPAGSPTPGFSSVQNWKDSLSARVGLEWLAWRGLALRAGVGYDMTPIPSQTLQPTVPTGDLLILSGGVGYTFRGFTLAAGYVAGIGTTNVATNPDYPATYHGLLQAVSVGLTYQWGAPTCRHCGTHCTGRGGCCSEMRATD